MKADLTPALSRKDDNSEIELSIIMPCLNEAETLEVCIRKADGYLQRSGVRGEIVIGDNGSTDGSQEIALRSGARVIAIPVRGYGAALYGATQAARGRYCIMGDSDDSYDFTNLDGFLKKLREGYDLVMGNRFTGEIKSGAMPWKNRYIGNPVLSAIGKVLFRAPVGDFHCGIRGFSKTAFNRMDLRTTGMEFASEMVIKATIMNMRMAEVPTTLSPDGRSRPPHLRPYRDGWRHLRFMLLFSPNWLFLYPGLALLFLGLMVGAILTAQPVTVDGVRLGLDTLIYCGSFIVIGFQAILFSMLSRIYAVQEGLYPPTATKDLLFGKLTLEGGLAAGIVVFLLGLVLAIYAVISWGQHGFGELDTEVIARLVIPSSIAMSLGMEIILSSFLMSTLALSVRHHANGPLKEYASAEVAAI
ncbi:MAG: glycosyltransferase family 2 protein [Acidobacteriaceae bacterium]|nr:glycosyltransferase family 2 protein [Acidobacteriaceae bacterium]